MPSYPPVQSVLRALDVLEELNRHGTTSIAELHRATGLPKPTLVRLLETLVFAGYASSGDRLGGYQVTSEVAKLSAGFHGSPLVVEAARPFALDLTRRLRWPVSVAVLEGCTMAVRFSTVPDSNVSPFHAPVGMRLSLVARGLGRAYLAWCPAAEREILLRMLAKLPEGEDNPPNLIAAVRGVLRTVRRLGYAERDPGAEPRNSNTLALPIRAEGRVLATIGIGFYRSAVPHAVLMDRLLPALRAAVQGTEQSLLALRPAAE